MLQIKIPPRSDEVSSKPRKKYMTKARKEEARQKEIKKNRFKGQQKAWDTRRALYPETNGYKPQQVEDKPKVELKGDKFREYNEEDVHPHSKKVDTDLMDVKPTPNEVNVLTAELAEKLTNLDDFLNSVPGVEFDREEFIREALTTAVDTVIEGVVVIVTGKEELTKKLKGMMEFVEEA